MLLSIVTPVFNEEEIVANFIDKLSFFLKKEKIDYELILVENGSTDKTPAIISDAAKKNSKLRVFHLPRPSYGQALRLGLKRAIGDYSVVFNVDFWEPKFLTMATKQNLLGADILVGSKNLPLSKDERPLKRKLITRGFMVFLRLFLGFKGTDTHGIKVFRRSVLDRLLSRCRLSSGLFDTELLIRAQRTGFKITEVPVRVKEIRRPRFKGRFLDTPKDICELFLALQKISDRIDLLLFFFILGICLLVLFPSFFLPWSLIDDGVLVQNTQRILEGLRTFNFNIIFSIFWENGVGRFRPIYWLYNFLSFLIGDKNPFFHHFLRFLNFWLVSLLGFLIAKKISGRTAGLFFVLFFVFSYLPFENWYRLGPQEPLSVFFLALTFYFLLKQKIYLAFWPIFISFLTKETNLGLLLSMLYLLVLNMRFKILDNNRLKRLVVKAIISGLLVLGLVALVKSGGGYSSHYSLGLKTVGENLGWYASQMKVYYGYFPLMALLLFLFSKKTKKETFWLSVIAVTAIFMLGIILPWPFPLGRYLLPAIFFLTLFLGVELSKLFNLLKRNLFLRLILIFYFIALLIQNGVIMAGTFYDSFQGNKVNEALVSYIASAAGPEKTVYLNLIDNDSTIEYFEEMKIHLNLFYGKDNNKLFYLKDLTQPKTGDLIVQGSLKPKFSQLPNNFRSKKTIEKQFKTLIVTTPVGFVKRMTRWGIGTIRGDRQMPDGIYTFYQGKYFWKIYEVF